MLLFWYVPFEDFHIGHTSWSKSKTHNSSRGAGATRGAARSDEGVTSGMCRTKDDISIGIDIENNLNFYKEQSMILKMPNAQQMRLKNLVTGAGNSVRRSNVGCIQQVQKRCHQT